MAIKYRVWNKFKTKKKAESVATGLRKVGYKTQVKSKSYKSGDKYVVNKSIGIVKEMRGDPKGKKRKAYALWHNKITRQDYR